MDIRGFEFYAADGSPASGLTVQAWDAVLGIPVGSPIASTTTDSHGMWEFTDLTDTPKDVKVSLGGRYRWYKGLTRHSMSELLLGDGIKAPGILNNHLTNGGFEIWRGPTSGFADGAMTADGWCISTGTSDVLAIGRDFTNQDEGSEFCMAASASIGADGAYLFQKVEGIDQYEGTTVTVCARILCATANAVAITLSTNSGATYPVIAYHSGSGVYETLSITQDIPHGSTGLIVAVFFAATCGAYIDNMTMVPGKVPMLHEREDAATELAKCGRYRQTFGAGALGIGGVATAANQRIRQFVPFHQKMRGTPTSCVFSGSWTLTGTTNNPEIDSFTADGFIFSLKSDAAGSFHAESNTAVLLAEYIP